MSPKVPFACELFLSDGVFPAITGDNKGLQAPPSPSHSNSMINRSIPPTIEIIPAKRCLNFRVRSHSRQWQGLNVFAHFESAHAMMVSDASLFLPSFLSLRTKCFCSLSATSRSKAISKILAVYNAHAELNSPAI
jgi:hypothetical protein